MKLVFRFQHQNLYFPVGALDAGKGRVHRDMNKNCIKIIYEDNHLLVVEKPVNVPSQEDSTGDKDFLSMLKEDVKRRYDKSGNVFLGLVHRLDRPVGGVMVFAKTSKAASRLSEQIRQREFEKAYFAVVHGTPVKSTGRLEHYLIKDGETNLVRVLDKSAKGAKEAILDYEVISSANQLSLVKVNLHTGRSHQIRVQLSSIGYPIYGDQKYGAGVNKPGQQIALWSVEIKLKHPIKNEEVTYKSIPPGGSYPWNLFALYLQFV